MIEIEKDFAIQIHKKTEFTKYEFEGSYTHNRLFVKNKGFNNKYLLTLLYSIYIYIRKYTLFVKYKNNYTIESFVIKGNLLRNQFNKKFKLMIKLL